MRGNHKSAVKYEEEFLKIIQSEIKRGWMIPLPIKYINELKHGELAQWGSMIRYGQNKQMVQERLSFDLHMTSPLRPRWDLPLIVVQKGKNYILYFMGGAYLG